MFSPVALTPKYQKKVVKARKKKKTSAISKRSASGVAEEDRPIFTPNPGGQAALFEDIPLDSPYQGNYRWFYFRGGVNGGKSWAGAAFCVSRTKIDPFARGLITANSYGQLETSTLVALVSYCQTYGHKIQVGQKRETLEGQPDIGAKRIVYNKGCFIDGVFCLVLTADVFDGKTASSKEAGRGLQIRWCWYDEAAYGTKNAFDTINTRLGRGEGSHKGLGLLTSSINKNNPYNYVYSYFDDPDRSDKLRKLHKTVTVSSRENLFMDDDFVASLEATYTKELIAIELRAEYASIGEGKVYSYFSRNIHVLPEFNLDNRFPIHISFDFNHHPCTAIAAQFLPYSEEVIILREWFLEYSDTFKLSQAVVDWLKEAKGTRTRDDLESQTRWQSYVVQIWGDATGNQKTANSKNSNWEIVKKTFSQSQIKFSARCGLSNPSVVDSVNSVNCALMAEKIWVGVNCKELIKDFESLAWDDKGGIDKKTDPMRSHVSDCLRYFVHGKLPYNKLTRDKRNSTQRLPVGVLL